MELQKNLIGEKSKRFAIRIVNLYKFLCEEKREYTLSNQILRSGTSIGANIAESVCAISKKDFQSKLYIALKETVETIYWLEILKETEYITQSQFQSLFDDCDEIRKILSSSTKTINESEKVERK